MTTRLLVAVAAVVFCAASLSASAGALTPQPFLYWAGYDGGTIGRASLNGSGANPNFVTGGDTPCSNVAVTTTYIYWSNYASKTIGRAKLNGTDVNQNFITGLGGPCGVTVYAGHLYWADYDSNTIGTAKLNGTGVNDSFVASAGSEPCGIAGGAGHVYWEDNGSDTVGRVKTNGSGATASFIPSAGEGCYGVAVDTHHIYWVTYDSGSSGHIARANLDGSSPNLDFIDAGGYASGVAITASYIYWSSSGQSTIGRAALNGTGANESFISNAPGNDGLGIGAPNTKTALHASPKTVHTGKRATYTATVTPRPDGGTVTFMSEGYPIAGCTKKPISVITGKAKCVRVYRTTGTWSIEASYSGDDSFVGSYSSTLTEKVK